MIAKIRKYTNENHVTISIIIVLIIGVILRFKGLLVQSYWLDEIISLTFSNPNNSFYTMYDMTVSDVHPPLYQMLLWVWFNFFSFTELSGRLLSAVFGSIGLFSIYFLGKELFNKQVGIYALIIASTNYFLIYYSQMVRSYSLLFLLSILSYIYLIKTLNSYTKYNFFKYLLSTILLMYTHYFGFFLVVTQVFVFIVYMIKDNDKIKLLSILSIITTVIFFLSLLPLIQYILEHSGKSSFWITTPSVFFLKNYFASYFGSTILNCLFFIILFFGVLSLFYKRTSKHIKYSIIVLLIWIFIGYLLPYVRSITATPLLAKRNTIIILPALIILISYGISLIKNNYLRFVLISLITLISINYLFNTIEYYSRITKQQWREVLYDVETIKPEFPVYDVVFDGNFYKNYASMLNINLDVQSNIVFKKKYIEKSLPNCFWIIEAHGDWVSKYKELTGGSINKVLEIHKNNARGVLYSYGIDKSFCQ